MCPPSVGEWKLRRQPGKISGDTLPDSACEFSTLKTAGESDESRQWVAEALVVAAFAVGLTFVFWMPLWKGGGFVGGDVYSYFLPQKALYAAQIADGALPLWNDRSGHGYPLVGESQTGVVYPFNVLLYSTLSLNDAYNANHLLHYILAFLFTAYYARELGVSLPGMLLTAMVFVYGWFPARCSLEWAIVGGTWLPLSLWCVERFLRRAALRYLIGLSVVLALQMLAGHFCLAFITQLVLSIYIPCRLRQRGDSGDGRRRPGVLLGAAVGCGFLLAAVQLVPTWELKQLSQRASVNDEHDPGYGHLPPEYLTQVVASWWYWYDPELKTDQDLQNLRFGALTARTNKVEAHLYFGLVPLLLAGAASVGVSVSRSIFRTWLLIAVLATVYATGCLIWVSRHLPGFSFFEGPARFGIATTFGIAVIAGLQVHRWTMVAKPFKRWCIAIPILLLTALDLWYISRMVPVAVMVDNPPISVIEQSSVRQILDTNTQPIRLFAPGPNLPNLLGHPSAPQYLGLSPGEYFDASLQFPGEVSAEAAELSTDQLDWLRRAGVTHYLSFSPLPQSVADGSLKALYEGPDVFLNFAWARGTAPLFLFEVVGAPGRAVVEPAEAGSAWFRKVSPTRLEIETSVTRPCSLVVADLHFPGWKVTVDGNQRDSDRAHGMYRAVELKPGDAAVVWSYEPVSVIVGCCISALTALFLAALAYFRFRQPGWLRL